MRLGCEMDSSIDLVQAEEVIDQAFIADISMDEMYRS
jgi:hypothetical protein